jgi:hypothetical protein
MERVRAAGKTAERKGKAVNRLLALSAFHKRCPQCQAEIHIRSSKCTCGYNFNETANK